MTQSVDRGRRSQDEHPSRLSWRVDVQGISHVIEIHPGLLGGDATVNVDGRNVAKVRTPSSRMPWSETHLLIGEATVTVAMTRGQLVPDVEVFANGRSLRSGRTIDEARRAAPAPVSAFQSWTHVNVGGVSDASLMPRWARVLALVCVALVALAPASRRSSDPSTWLGVLSANAVFLLGVRAWLILTARTRRYLTLRPDLGDRERLLRLVTVFVGIPLIAAVGIFAVTIVIP